MTLSVKIATAGTIFGIFVVFATCFIKIGQLQAQICQQQINQKTLKEEKLDKEVYEADKIVFYNSLKNLEKKFDEKCNRDEKNFDYIINKLDKMSEKK